MKAGVITDDLVKVVEVMVTLLNFIKFVGC